MICAVVTTLNLASQNSFVELWCFGIGARRWRPRCYSPPKWLFQICQVAPHGNVHNRTCKKRNPRDPTHLSYFTLGPTPNSTSVSRPETKEIDLFRWADSSEREAESSLPKSRDMQYRIYVPLYIARCADLQLVKTRDIFGIARSR